MAADHFCLKWNNFHNSIVTVFESLQSSEELVDVTLMCEGQNVKAHKVILSACSPYFRNLFKEIPCQHPVIILKDVLHSDLVAILQFMYQGEVLITQDGLASFLKTAELLQVSGLAGNPATTRTTAIESNLPTQVNVPLRIPSPVIPLSPTSPAKSTTTIKNHASPVTESISKEIEHIDTEQSVLSQFEAAIEPIQSCSYEPQEEMVIKTEADEVEFTEMDYTSMSHDHTNDSGPPTEEQSILERSLKAHGISPHPTKLYTTDLVIGPQIEPQKSSSPNQTTQLPELIKTHRVTPLVLIKTELAKRNFEHLATIKKIPVKCILPKVDAKKPKLESKPTEPSQQQPPKTDVSHGSQFGKCPHCTKVYSNQSALKYHVRLVHSDMLNMFCCHLCPESFEYRESYKVHMWEIHSVRN